MKNTKGDYYYKVWKLRNGNRKYQNYFNFDFHSAWLWLWLKKFPWDCHLHSPLTTWYQYPVVGKYCTLCIQIAWLLKGANRHEAPWKPALFTSSFWCCQYIKTIFTRRATIRIHFWPDWYHFKQIIIFRIVFWTMLQLDPQEACWNVENGEYFSLWPITS